MRILTKPNCHTRVTFTMCYVSVRKHRTYYGRGDKTERNPLNIQIHTAFHRQPTADSCKVITTSRRKSMLLDFQCGFLTNFNEYMFPLLPLYYLWIRACAHDCTLRGQFCYVNTNITSGKVRSDTNHLKRYLKIGLSARHTTKAIHFRESIEHLAI